CARGRNWDNYAMDYW
nr:immunoglobulin heavy chain junction region [Mus musculus]